MTKVEEFEKTWRLGYKNDFQWLIKFTIPNIRHLRETQVLRLILKHKIIISTYGEYLTIGPIRLIFEDENFVP